MLPKMSNNPLCADCGQEIQPHEWQPPETSLCPACEKRMGSNEVAWCQKLDQDASVLEQVVIHKKAA